MESKLNLIIIVNGYMFLYKNMYGEIRSNTYDENGLLHSFNDEPAVITSHVKQWYKNGKLHRDGKLPAVEYENGDVKYYINGFRKNYKIYGGSSSSADCMCLVPLMAIFFH